MGYGAGRFICYLVCAGYGEALYRRDMLPSQNSTLSCVHAFHSIMYCCFQPINDKLLLGLGEKSLVLLLSLNECFLEEVGVCRSHVSENHRPHYTVNLLSLLAKRMARVCASGSPSLTSAAAFQTQLRSLPTLGDNFISGTTMEWSVFPRTMPPDGSSYRSGWHRP